MSGRVPLGQKESLRLEFKGRETLKKPESIARAVVAMLNARGGVVWVGVRAENDRAVAIEPIANVENARRQLRDYLVDTVEPSPGAEEVNVETVAEEGEGQVIRVIAEPGKNRLPYSHIKEGGRFFFMRITDRTRLMAREEIRERFSRGGRRSVETAIEAMLAERGKIVKEAAAAGKQIFSLRLKPEPSAAELDLSRVRDSDLLIDAAATGNRRSGSNFTVASRLGGRLRPEAGRLEVGQDSDPFHLRLERSGGIEFVAPLKSFYTRDPRAERLLYSDALCEYLVSILRLLSTLVRDSSWWSSPPPEDMKFIADILIIGLEGWSLRPGSLHRKDPHLLQLFSPETYQEADFVLDRPLIFALSEVQDNPDRCGRRLVERIYEAFGFGPEDLPEEFDRESGRLVLPE